MKWTIFIFIFLGLTFLLSPPKQKVTNAKEIYLGESEIISRLKDVDFTNPVQVSIEESENEKRREKSLTPLDKFFPKGYLYRKKIHKNKKLNRFLEIFKDRPGADLRYRDTTIKLQWDGTCTTFAGVAGIENMLNSPKIDLSERDSWNKYGIYSTLAFINALTRPENRICLESDWPQTNKKPFPTCKTNRKWGLLKTKFIEDDIGEALDALDRGHVVYLGMSTPKEMVQCKPIISINSKFSKGGHALLIVGYDSNSTIPGGGYFIVKNSWGKNCGDKGYQYLPYDICNKEDGYCIMWEFEKVAGPKIKPLPEPSPTPQLPSITVCTPIWYMPWKKNCVIVN